MLRVAGSLKLGWVTASLFVQKLQAFPQQGVLARSLQEYGRLLHTLYILRWYDDEAGRRRINRQLNKGEALHSLRSAISIANKGQLRRKQEGASQRMFAHRSTFASGSARRLAKMGGPFPFGAQVLLCTVLPSWTTSCLPLRKASACWNR